MVKKFLSLLTALAVLTTSTAFAAGVITGGGSGDAVLNYIENFSAKTPSGQTTFNPSTDDFVNVSFDLRSTARLYVYVLDSSYQTKAVFVDKVATSAGSISYRWFATVNNAENGTPLADGTYSVRAFAYSVTSNDVVDYDYATVEIKNEVPVLTPVITSLSATPATIEQGQSSVISIGADQNVTLNVEIKKGATLVRSFSPISYTRPAFLYQLTWDGKKADGTKADIGVHTVYVSATNANGSYAKSTSITVSAGTVPTPPHSPGIIDYADVNPNTWTPGEDDDLELEWELSEDADDFSIYLYTCPSGATSFTDDCRKEVKIFEDTNLRADEKYEETWDGEDGSDFVDAGKYFVVFTAKNSSGKIIGQDWEVLTVKYNVPKFDDIIITKDEIDTSKGEFVSVAFRLSEDSEVDITVERKDGSDWDRVRKLEVDLDVEGDEWVVATFDEKKKNGTYRFYVEARNPNQENVKTVATKEFKIADDDVTSTKSNATNDYTEPVVFDISKNEYITFSYCIDKDAEVSLAVYNKLNPSGSAKVELLDWLEQDKGCHTVQWDGTDEDGDELPEDIYSYELVTKTSGNRKDTEVGRFVIGEISTSVTPPTPPTPQPGYCGTDYYDLTTVSDEMCEAITWTTDMGIFQGYGDGSFKPYRIIDRAETLKVVLEAYRGKYTMLPANGSNLGFKDLDVNAWYIPYMRTAKFYGLLHGYIDSTEARPHQTINRVEFLKFALEAADAFVEYEVPGHEVSGYADVQKDFPNNVWYFDYAGVAATYGLYNVYVDAETGEKLLKPGQDVARGEVALLLYRMYKAGLLN